LKRIFNGLRFISQAAATFWCMVAPAGLVLVRVAIAGMLRQRHSFAPDASTIGRLYRSGSVFSGTS